MAKLTGQTIADSYDQLLIVTGASGITSSLQAVESGDTDGAVAALQISTVAAAIDNPTASSATQGGKLTLFSDDGAALGDTHRLGVIEFSAAEDTGSTITIGARIEAIADAAWSASENGADMVFYTTDGNASQTEVLRLTADNNVGIGTAAPATILEIETDAALNAFSSGVGTLQLTSTVARVIDKGPYISFQQIAEIGTQRDAGAIGVAAENSAGSGTDRRNHYMPFFLRNLGSGMREVMRIGSTGNVGIGADAALASTLIDSSARTLTILSPNAYSILKFQNSGGKVSEMGLASADGNFQLFVDGTIAMNIDDDTQDISVSTGNLIIGTAGKGIDFSAQTATSVSGTTVTAEVLDHYEEGTWTAVPNGGTSIANSVGHYVKIGRMVHVSWYSGAMTGDGAASTITGLPFTAGNENNEYWVCYTSHDTWSNAGGGYVTKNNTYVEMQILDSTSTATSDSGSGKYIMMTATYAALT